MDFIASIALLGDNVAVICGNEDDVTKIKGYNLETGAEIICLNLEDAYGLAEVKIGGKMALAVSFSSQQKIEFHAADDLRQVLCTHSVVPHLPTILCTAAMPPSVLYLDLHKNPREVHWLELSESQPKPAKHVRIRGKFTGDFCVVQDGNRQLLIVVSWDEADDNDNIFAYNTETDTLEWKMSGQPPGRMDISGIASDGRGHLFVADMVNRCIHLLSTSHGQYLGHFMKDTEVLGDPAILCWCKEILSLIAACAFDGNWDIKVIKVKY